jgi:hypothetical protein
MRGAMTLFLSWLFWKQGGLEWDHTNKLDLVDLGGIAFLKRMVRLDEIGWESIGTAFERPVDELFMEFISALNKQNNIDKPSAPILDPYTGQPVEFFANMQIANNKDNSVIFIKPTPRKKDDPTSLLPWSFCFIEPVISEQTGSVKAMAKKLSGRSFVSFMRGHDY